MDILIAQDEDWAGLYIDGKLVVEDHSLSAENVLDALGYKYRWVEVDLDRGGRLPYNAVDIVTATEAYVDRLIATTGF